MVICEKGALAASKRCSEAEGDEEVGDWNEVVFEVSSNTNYSAIP